ncbi:hypothetical protein HAX54_036624 [Datura stramonium]|uniref:Uncharacterized protein n=1 Tax=Datura stramonium TaxID=4076 RepID=A0ABS8VHY7_DATST|nr:hypothetical protein [Datura stramonium]
MSDGRNSRFHARLSSCSYCFSPTTNGCCKCWANCQVLYNCPDNAFQMALPGSHHTHLFAKRIGAIVLFAVAGTASSLVGTVITNAVLNAKRLLISLLLKWRNLPVLSTSVAWCLYGSFQQPSSKVHYDFSDFSLFAKNIAHRYNEYRLVFQWVDYARLIGIQKAHEEVPTQKAHEA